MRDALGLTKGTLLKVELEGSRIILRKSVDDAISRVRGKFALDGFESAEQAVRASRDGRSGLRRLLHVDLWEISVVTFPMHPGARVTAASDGKVVAMKKG